ncbi:MOSC domain-containing protein [Alteribacillus bidgolensis]|uniref:MOSC domain-containing protein YiiM n=1 Tax=Alteribacillus bidgolensis TaxID=930129 RepID=A0A1G8JBF9_9BACI|nr:MOSC domain-containing protein [Alteribacillus bidgolensis]SDI28614.1 MOSC domain-containing protein YiiM [Alteribacillus bidgolensis]
MSSSYFIQHLAAGRPQLMMYQNGKVMKTGIQKQSVEEIYAAEDGLENDEVADKKNHGGTDRVICIYPYDHYLHWESECNTKLADAAFGENITARNMTEEKVCIGDTYKIGDAIIQVTQGRIPCDTISRRNNIPNLLSRVVETGYTGFLCRVLKEGTIRKTDTIQLVEQHLDKVTVAYSLHTYFHNAKDLEALQKIAAVDALAESWREKVEKRINQLTG